MQFSNNINAFDYNVLSKRINDSNGNLMKLIVLMGFSDYNKKFLYFLFEIIDEGYQITVLQPSRSLSGILQLFDVSVLIEEKIRLLPSIGNDLFQDFAIEYLINYDPENTIMMSTLMRVLIENDFYISIQNPRYSHSITSHQF